MVDLVHLILGTIGIMVFSALFIYSFRLINKFFKGGIFEAPFKAFMATGVLVAAGLVFDIVSDILKPKSLDQYIIHIFHLILEILAAATLLYGVHMLYKAWTKLGEH